MKKSYMLLREFHQTFFRHTPEERFSRAMDIARAFAQESGHCQRVWWNREASAWEVRKLPQPLPTLQEVLTQDWTYP